MCYSYKYQTINNTQYTINNKQYVNYKLYTGTQTHLRRQQGRMVKVSLFCKNLK